MIAEHAGDRSPGGMQHLLGRAKWDADGVRDDVRSYVTEYLGEVSTNSARYRELTGTNQE